MSIKARVLWAFVALVAVKVLFFYPIYQTRFVMTFAEPDGFKHSSGWHCKFYTPAGYAVMERRIW